MLGEAENHEHKPIEYSTIFSENGYTLYVGRGRKPRTLTNQIFHYFLWKWLQWGIVLLQRKRERNSGIIKKEKVGRRLPS